MHALETLVSIAAEGASSVKGGNRLIFEHFANHSGAAVHLSSPVTSLKKLQAPRTSRTPEWQLSHTVDGLDSTGTFDVVLIAAPWHQTGIQVTGSDASQTVGPPVEYIDLHVTIAITNASAPQACYFNPAWACKDPAPNTMYELPLRQTFESDLWYYPASQPSLHTNKARLTRCLASIL